LTPPKDVLAANLARERRRQCKSMETLARLAGTHASEISRLEHGQRDPRLWTIVRLAHALDVPLAVLMQGIGKREESAQDA
jgi:transcriptional regulator with XRE-family HTH domain